MGRRTRVSTLTKGVNTKEGCPYPCHARNFNLQLKSLPTCQHDKDTTSSLYGVKSSPPMCIGHAYDYLTYLQTTSACLKLHKKVCVSWAQPDILQAISSLQKPRQVSAALKISFVRYIYIYIFNLIRPKTVPESMVWVFQEGLQDICLRRS